MSKRNSTENEPEDVYIVMEEGPDTLPHVRKVFDDPDAANAFVEDPPEDAGELFVEIDTVESNWSEH